MILSFFFYSLSEFDALRDDDIGKKLMFFNLKLTYSLQRGNKDDKVANSLKFQ